MRLIVCVLLGLFFIGAGRAHFQHPRGFLAIMPDWIPVGWHRFLVDFTGVLEILGGAFLMFPQTRVSAAWFLIALLLPIFPANVHMAVHNLPFGKWQPPLWVQWARLPLQFVLIAVVAWAGGLFAKTSR